LKEGVLWEKLPKKSTQNLINIPNPNSNKNSNLMRNINIIKKHKEKNDAFYRKKEKKIKNLINEVTENLFTSVTWTIRRFLGAMSGK
jgi:hypothetical protein